MTVLHCCNYWR